MELTRYGVHYGKTNTFDFINDETLALNGITGNGFVASDVGAYRLDELGFQNLSFFTLTITDLDLAVTPEPCSFMLLGTGLLGMAGVVKRRFA